MIRTSDVRPLLGAWALILLLMGAVSPAHAGPPDSTDFEAGRAAFAVRFGDTQITHRIMAVTAMPDTTIRISVAPGLSQNDRYQLNAPVPLAHRLSSSSWRFSAPAEPGLYPVLLTNPTTRATVRLQVFVLSPWDHEGRRLNGYRIGNYEMEPRNGRAVYEPPAGFVKVTAENKDARVAPHFRLDQFLCKQTGTPPQYALVRPRLLRHLEDVLAAVNARGHAVPTLQVMSGYRTPYYNRSIGNTTEYSRHLYGDAADIFVDADGDRWMDDLTGDGRTTLADARYLADIVRGIPTPGDDRFNGGLSAYDATSVHGPFVHLDLRGRRVRW
ncbi:MAG: D-Ala-D-Ala carboxypeptidase family metallohydrolase [Salinibacter sp.]